MLSARKVRALIFFGVAIVVILVLAAGIADILRSPDIFTGEELAANPLLQWLGMRLGRNIGQLFYIFFGLYLLALISMFLTPEGRKRFLILFALVAIVSIGIYLIPPQQLVVVTPTEVAATVTPGEILPTLSPAIEQPEIAVEPPKVADWFVTVMGVGLALLLAGLIAVLVLLFSRPRQKISLPEVILEEAQIALEALDEGDDFQSVLIRCYARLSQVLLAERGVERGTGVTPHEFQETLLRSGFPAEAVKVLTSLFERVRYGIFQPTEEDVQMAKTSLEVLVDYCRTENGSPHPVERAADEAEI